MNLRALFVLLLLLPTLIEGAVQWSKNAPGGFSATADFSTNELSVQDLLTVTLQLNYPDSYHTNLDQLQKNLLRHTALHAAPFTLFGNPSNQHEETSDHTIKQTVVFTLQPQLPGISSLTFYDIQFLPNTPKDKPVVIISDFIEVEIAKPEAMPSLKPWPLLTLSPALPIEINDNNLKSLQKTQELQKQRNLTLMQQSSLPWFEIALALLVIILIIVMKYAPAKEKKPEETPSQRMERLRQESFTKIESLHQQKLLEKHQYAPFYMGVAETVRHYMDEKYRLSLTTKTTPEILQQMQEIHDPDLKQRLEQFFLRADGIKFAQEPPTLADCQAAEQTAKDTLKGEEW